MPNKEIKHHISVIIPCFNVDQYIEKCVESVINQTYQPKEIICVDNGSEDQTLKVLCQLAQKNSLIKVLEQPTQGACAARNLGLQAASGEWIQFLDADDLLVTDKLSHQKGLINESLDLIAGASIYQRLDRSTRITIPIDDPWYGVFSTNYGITTSNLWRRKKVLEVNGWAEDLRSSQEYDLMFRMLKNGALMAIDAEPKTIIRERESGSISKTDPGAKWKRYLNLRTSILRWLRENKPDYLASHEDEYLQKLFEVIRFLYPYNQEKALIVYREFIREGFQPQISSVNTKFYVNTFRLFGLEHTEKLRSIFSDRIAH